MIEDHWQTKNHLYWSVDVTLHEDKSRMRKLNSAENFGMLRKFVFNLLRKDPTKQSLHMKRKRASWNPNIMFDILNNSAIASI